MNGQLRIRSRQAFDLKCATSRAYMVAIIATISIPRTSRGVRSMRAAWKSGIRSLFCVPVFTELCDFAGLFGENTQHARKPAFHLAPCFMGFCFEGVFVAERVDVLETSIAFKRALNTMWAEEKRAIQMKMLAEAPKATGGVFYPSTPNEFITLFAHFHRAEIARMAGWRDRIDRTTNWAITVVAAMLSVSLFNPRCTS